MCAKAINFQYGVIKYAYFITLDLKKPSPLKEKNHSLPVINLQFYSGEGF